MGHGLAALGTAGDPPFSLPRAAKGTVAKSFSLAISAAALLAVSAAHAPWTHYAGERERISYELPSAWQVQKEDNLEKIGYLSAPYPAYTLLAGAEPPRLAGVPNPPSGYALSETPSPWFMVLVESATSPAPSPEKAYELAPEGEVTFQEEQGLDPTVIRLTKPLYVSSGAIRGSTDRSEVIVPGAGDLELDEVVYTEGHTAWIAMAGCTVACYNANAVTVNKVISSVTVGAGGVGPDLAGLFRHVQGRTSPRDGKAHGPGRSHHHFRGTWPRAPATSIAM